MRGWEPAEVTHYIYEGDRVVRSVTVREPEFSSDDLRLLLASGLVEADVGSHGVSMTEATAKENQFAFTAEPVIDFAAKAIGDASDTRRKQFPDEPHHGVTWRVKKKSKT